MKRLLLIFTFIGCSIFSSKAQNQTDLFFEYSPHFAHIYNFDDYATYKFSHMFRFQADLKVSDRLSFSPAFSYLNTGAKSIWDKYVTETIGVDFLLMTLGTKLEHNKFYFLPEFGIAVFLRHINGTRDNGEWYRYTSDSLEIDYNVTLSKTPLLTGLTLGYEFQQFKKTWRIGLKSYLFLNASKETRNEKVVYPHGVGLNIGIKL